MSEGSKTLRLERLDALNIEILQTSLYKSERETAPAIFKFNLADTLDGLVQWLSICYVLLTEIVP